MNEEQEERNTQPEIAAGDLGRKKKRWFTLLILGGMAVLSVLMLEFFVLPEGWDMVALHSDEPDQIEEALLILGGEYAESNYNDPQLEAVFAKTRERVIYHMQQHMRDADMTEFNQWSELWPVLNEVTGETEPVPIRAIQMGGR